MTGYIRQITPFELASFRRNPGQIKELLDAEAPAAPLQAGPIRELLPGGGGRLELQTAPKNETRLSLGNNWQTLHYLLTGTAGDAPPPLGNAILGRRKIGADLGYGPARFLTPVEVREVAAALAAVSSDELARRFDAAALERAGVSGEEGLESNLRLFEQLVQYYREAAARGNAVLLYLR